MIVLTLVAIFVAVMAPLVASANARNSVQHAANRFIGKHSLARTLAIRHGAVSELHVDVAAGKVWVQVDTSSAGSGAVDTVGLVLDLSAEKVSVASDETLFCFDARGLAAMAPGCPASGDATLVFSRDDWADTVATSALGMILH